MINAPFSLSKPQRKASTVVFFHEFIFHLDKEDTPHFLGDKNLECEVKLHSFVAYLGGWVFYLQLMPFQYISTSPVKLELDATTQLYVHEYEKATIEQQEKGQPTKK